MKKFLTYVLVFIALVVAADFFVGAAGDYMRSNSEPGPVKQLDDLLLHDCHDILVMGSSRARHHYVPSVLRDSLGYDVFNAGYDGNGIILAYGLLSVIVRRYCPKLVIYDMEPTFDIFESDNSRFLSELRPYCRYGDIMNLSKAIDPYEPLKDISGLYRYNSKLPYMLLEFLKPTTCCENGYLPIDSTMDPVRSAQVMKGPSDSLKLRYLEKFIGLCEEKGIRLVICFSPKFGMCGTEEFLPAIELCARKNVPVVDHYSDPQFLNHPSLFADPVHLNPRGAEEYTSKVAERIKRL